MRPMAGHGWSWSTGHSLLSPSWDLRELLSQLEGRKGGWRRPACFLITEALPLTFYWQGVDLGEAGKYAPGMTMAHQLQLYTEGDGASGKPGSCCSNKHPPKSQELETTNSMYLSRPVSTYPGLQGRGRLTVLPQGPKRTDGPPHHALP